MNPSLCMCGAGYHDGFVIPAGATNIQITEDPVNPSVHLGECVYMLKGNPTLYINTEDKYCTYSNSIA